MISVIATIIFFFVLFEAFNSSYTPQSVVRIYSTQIYDYILIPKNIIHSTFSISHFINIFKKFSSKQFSKVLSLSFIGYIELFQEPVSSLMMGIIDLHNDIMVILVFISLFVMW